jgi:hypothetical protein
MSSTRKFQTHRVRNRWDRGGECSPLSLTSRELFTKNSAWQAKQSVSRIAVTFYGDCIKMFEDFAPNFGDKRAGCCITTVHRLLLPFSPRILWPKTTWLLSHTLSTLFLCFPDWQNWKATILTQLRWSRQNRRRCGTLSQNTTPRTHLKMTSAGKGPCDAREVTTSRVMLASRNKGSFFLPIMQHQSRKLWMTLCN